MMPYTHAPQRSSFAIRQASERPIVEAPYMSLSLAAGYDGQILPSAVTSAGQMLRRFWWGMTVALHDGQTKE